MHFNYDKAYVDELHEGDWTINAAMAAAYRGVLEEVKTHQLAA
jgi:hypothetical protein